MIDYPKELARIRSRKLTHYDENRVRPTESELMRDIEILEAYITELSMLATVGAVDKAESTVLRKSRNDIFAIINPLVDF